MALAVAMAAAGALCLDAVSSGAKPPVRATLAGPRYAAPGGGAGYVLAITNTEEISLSAVVVTVTVESPLVVAATSDGGVADTADQARWDLGTLAPGESRRVDLWATLPYTAPAGASLAATATLARAGDAEVEVDRTALDVRPVDLAVAVTGGPAEVIAGSRVTSVVTVGNLAPVTANEVTVDIALSPGTTWMTDSLRAADAGATRSATPHGVRWTWDSLGPGDERRVSLVTGAPSQVSATAAVAVTATASSACRDDGPANDVGRYGPAPVVPGPPASAEVEVRPAAIPLRDGRATVRVTVRDGHANPVRDGTAVVLSTTGGSLSTTSSRTELGTANATVRAGDVPGRYTVAAIVGAVRGEARLSVRPADLGLTGMAVGPRGRARESRTYPGERLEYQLIVSNEDLSTARGVELAAVTAESLRIATVTAARPITAATTSRLDAGGAPGLVQRWWRLPDIEAGGRMTITLHGALDRSRGWDEYQTMFFRSAITTTTPEGSTADMVSMDQAGVYAADYRVAAALDWETSSVRPGGSLAYDVSFGNAAPGDDGSVRITNTLPAGVTYDTWQPDPVTTARLVAVEDELRKVVWEVDGAQARSGSLRLWGLVDPKVAPGATLVNEVAIGSSVYDRDASNDRSVDSVRLAGVNLRTTVSGPATASAGEEVAYDVLVENRSPVDEASQVIVEAVPPPGASIAYSDPPAQAVPDGRARWVVPRIGVGGAVALRVGLVVGDRAVVGTTVELAVQATAVEPESYPADNRGVASTRIVPGSPAHVAVSAVDEVLVACGLARTTLRAIVTDPTGHAVSDGTAVAWTSTSGSLVESTSLTAAGRATVVLVAARSPSDAEVVASAGGTSGRTTVRMIAGPPSSLAVSADPVEVPRGGRTRIAAHVLDGCANEVADGWPIVVTADRGSMAGAGREAVLATVGGAVRADLAVGDEPGPLRIRAAYGGEFAETMIAVRPGPVETPTPGPRHRLFMPVGSR